MTLIDFTIQLTRTNDLLEDLTLSNRLIAEALTRLSPPLPSSDRVPYRAGIRDLINADPSSVESLLMEQADLGARTGTIPRTDAFYAMVREYEETILKEYGQEAVDSLPWNKVQRNTV